MVRHGWKSILIVLLATAAACTPVATVTPANTAMPVTDTAQPTVVPATATSPATPEPVNTVTVDDSGLATFTSSDLGIQFTYLASVDGTAIDTQVVGDKVYIYAAGTEPTRGQFVQVFSKAPEQSLADAITEKLLAGYSPADCPITPADSLNPSAPDTYTYATMDVPRDADDTLAELNAKGEKCPPYLNVGGLAFFAADSAHPATFAFFSIGQYAILSADDTPWQNTFTFID